MVFHPITENFYTDWNKVDSVSFNLCPFQSDEYFEV